MWCWWCWRCCRKLRAFRQLHSVPLLVRGNGSGMACSTMRGRVFVLSPYRALLPIHIGSSCIHTPSTGWRQQHAAVSNKRVGVGVAGVHMSNVKGVARNEDIMNIVQVVNAHARTRAHVRTHAHTHKYTISPALSIFLSLFRTTLLGFPLFSPVRLRPFPSFSPSRTQVSSPWFRSELFLLSFFPLLARRSL